MVYVSSPVATNQREYVASDGTVCPHCASENVSRGGYWPEAEGGAVKWCIFCADSPRQVAKTLEGLKDNGLDLSDLTKATVAEALKNL